MRCLNPRTVGFQPDGKTIAWSQKQYSKEFATFQLPCGKCIECRLEYGRQWATRAEHEAQIHKSNAFVTLTYSDEHLGDNKLNYDDFQTFMKDLRDATDYKYEIGFMAVGEYGAKSKRKHWHACLFGWRPDDGNYLFTNELDQKLYTSEFLEKIWKKGQCNFGDVTFESAGYVARYSAKKLVHGLDQEHEYQPIFKTSRKYAIGKRFLEKYYKSIFNLGSVRLENGKQCSIPRYYEKWLQKNDPVFWQRYVTEQKAELIKEANEKTKRIQERENKVNSDRFDKHGSSTVFQVTRNQARKKISEKRLKNLQDKQKF